MFVRETQGPVDEVAQVPHQLCVDALHELGQDETGIPVLWHHVGEVVPEAVRGILFQELLDGDDMASAF